MPDIENTNQLMATVVNQYVEPIYNWLWIRNPWQAIIPRGVFNTQDGLVPKVVTSTCELPTSYPDWANLGLSDGTGSSCDVTPVPIIDGTIQRNYQLEVFAANTRVLCLTDLQFTWSARQEIANLQSNIQQYITTTWSDWYRVKSICMANNKISTEAAGAIFQDTNSDCDFSSITGGDLPSANLSWDHLNPIYDIIWQMGGEPNAVGYSEGQPLITLICGPGVKRNLWQDDTKVRDTVNWGDAFQNFTARGINTSINGYIPNVDLYPMRFDAGMQPIYPFQNVAATTGMKSQLNPAYKTEARDGNAVYEAFYIYPNNIWEAKVRPIGTTAYDMATFDPVNYVGDIQWLNIKTPDTNPLGNKGWYRTDIQVAARPIRPELAYAGLTLAVD